MGRVSVSVGVPSVRSQLVPGKGKGGGGGGGKGGGGGLSHKNRSVETTLC